jgi:enoyl-[acyl-carrier-protein] reductase (NADH)
LTQRFEDTALQAGVEAMSAALIYYGSIKTAAAKGIGNAPEIFEDLGKRFPGKSKTTKPPTV